MVPYMSVVQRNAPFNGRNKARIIFNNEKLWFNLVLQQNFYKPQIIAIKIKTQNIDLICTKSLQSVLIEVINVF